MTVWFHIQVFLNIFSLADFNSVPESGVIEYITRGRVSTTHHEFKHIGYKDCLLKMLSHSKNDQGSAQLVMGDFNGNEFQSLLTPSTCRVPTHPT